MSKTKIITAAEMADHYRPLGELYAAFKRIEKLEADNARLREALEWALAEVEGRTRYSPNNIYDAEEQRANALDCAVAALQETSHD